MSNKTILYLIPCNHFDLAWRRPFRTNMDNKGEAFIPYSKIEQYYIEDNIKLCEKYPEYMFCIEATSIVREFLKNRPDLKDKLFALAKEGRVFVPGSGDAIVDSNLILGETTIRNYLTGLLWVEDNLGQKNRQAFRADAFGNAAQLPQIFRGCEMDHAMNLDYAVPNGKYWRGLDGSTVVCHYHKNCGNGGNPYKYTACKKCGGSGVVGDATCSECNGRGIDEARAAEFYFPFQVNEKLLEAKGVGYIKLAPEEYLPREEVILRAREFSKKYDVRFVNPEKPLEDLEEFFKDVDDVALSDLNNGIELNPANTGCYVTRIKSKQVMRKHEYATLSAETLSVSAWLKGAEYPKEEFLNLWYDLFYMAFHDCVTGTVVDPAFEELERDREKIDNNISVLRNKALTAITNKNEKLISIINAFGFAKTDVVEIEIPAVLSGVKITNVDTGEKLSVIGCEALEDKTIVKVLVKDIKPFSVVKLTWGKAAAIKVKQSNESVIENSRFKIVAEKNGIASVYDKKLQKFISVDHDYRFGELILEHDEGNAWATLTDSRKRYRLEKYTELVATNITPNYQQLVFKVNSVMRYVQRDVSGMVTVTLTEGIDRIDFHAEFDWDSFNHRLRVAFPINLNGKNMYGVPYGYMPRNEYIPKYNWSGVDGDYPAINWAGVDDGTEAVAVINRGIPSYKIEQETRSIHLYTPSGSVVFLSLLRSPTVPDYLHEPLYYSAYNWEGQRDTGHHSFDYAVCAYDDSFAHTSIEADAMGFNARLIATLGEVSLGELPEINSQNTYISSIKLAEKSDALIVRIAEFRGKKGEVMITLPNWAESVDVVNMLERENKPLIAENGVARLSVRAFEIVTLSFKKR